MNRIPNLCNEPRFDHAGDNGELRMQILQTVNDESPRPARRAIQTEKGGSLPATTTSGRGLKRIRMPPMRARSTKTDKSWQSLYKPTGPESSWVN